MILQVFECPGLGLVAFQAALTEAVQLAEPKAATYSLPRKSLSSQEEIDAYLVDLRSKLETLLKDAKSIILK